MKRIFQSLATTNDGAFIIDRSHRIIFWNQAAEEMLGYTVGDVVGRPCYELLGGRDEQGRTLCQRYCLAAIMAQRGDPLPNQEMYARTKTGERRWLNVTSFAYPVRDKTIGQVIVHLFRDATEQKNYQRFISQVMAASERLKQDNGRQLISSAPTEPRADGPTAREWQVTAASQRLHQDNGRQLISSAPTEPRAAGLTAREWQVLELLAQGLGTDEIASTLTISPATARNHVQNTLNKLGVHSRLEAVAYAYQHGMIEGNGL